MFKKAVEAKSHQRLSGADRKKLRRTVQNRFSLLTDDLLNAILPPKVCFFLSLTSRCLESGDKADRLLGLCSSSVI